MDRPLGVRRLPPPRGFLSFQRYELRHHDGDAASCTLDRLDELLDGRHRPADYWATVDAANAAHDASDGRLVEVTTGRLLDQFAVVPGETFRTSWSGWIESSAGYRIRGTGRAGHDYEDEDGPARIDTEMMAIPGHFIFVDNLPAGRPTILGRVCQLILWSGEDVHLVPSPQSW